jgi:hypothetical protein
MLTKYHRKKSSIRRFGTCPICTLDTKLVADHCHTTGLTRDPLCRKCNMALGLMNDSPSQLRAAASYLERHALAHQQYRDRP